MKTVLITAIGSFSANAVIQTFRKKFNFRVIGCDIYPSNWLAFASNTDKFYRVTPSSKERAYIHEILEICQRENIDYLIPLTDPEVDALSTYRKELEKKGVVLCLSNNTTIEICRNKYKTYDFFKKDSLVNVIPTFTTKELTQYEKLTYPLIAKPVCGRSSEGLYTISNSEELKFTLEKKEYIIQPLYNGEIYTVDYVRNSKSGRDFSISRKELIRTTNGAGVTVEIVKDSTLNNTVSYIGTLLNVNGCMNFEFIFYDNKYFLMDANPRFSAGIGFSLLAGYNMIVSHMNCFMDRDIVPPISYELLIATRKCSEILTKKV